MSSDFRHREYLDPDGLRAVELMRVKKTYGSIVFDPSQGRMAYVAIPAEGRPSPTGCLADAIRHIFLIAGASSSRPDVFDIIPISEWLNSVVAVETSAAPPIVTSTVVFDQLSLLDEIRDLEAAA